MKVFINPSNSQDIIVTTAIGQKYLDDWFNFAYPSWEKYCKKHQIGLIVFDQDLVSQETEIWKKPYWQKLLIGNYLKQNTNYRGNICFLDSDILINSAAPNVFSYYDPTTIGLVSQKNNIPYPLEEVLRRIAFFRHNFMDKNYPLDSYLFATTKKIFELHNLPPQPDFACTGMFLFNIQNHAKLFKNWYDKYSRDMETMDGGTEEVHLNYEIQNYGQITWLNYKFQSLWIYEMAWKYPFLYYRNKEESLIKNCIESSLLGSYFLHFAGAWEGDMWKIENIATSDQYEFIVNEFSNYMKFPLTGEPKGIIKPQIKDKGAI